MELVLTTGAVRRAKLRSVLIVTVKNCQIGERKPNILKTALFCMTLYVSRASLVLYDAVTVYVSRAVT